MKTVIIGSKGYIGMSLVRALQKKEGFDVQGFSSSNGECIDPVTGLLCDKFSIPAGTDAIIYLAQSPYYRQVPEMAWHLWNVNVVSAIKIAELARKAKVKRFIYTSTGNVYAPSFDALKESSPLRRDNCYSLSKIHAEEALSMYTDYFDLTILRIFGVYGPGQKDKLVPTLFASIRRDKTIFFDRNPDKPEDTDGLKITLCFIDDIVSIISDLLHKGGPSVLNVAGDETISLRELVTRMCQYTNKKTNGTSTESFRKSDLIADISLLKTTLNPQFTSFKCGLNKTLESFDL